MLLSSSNRNYQSFSLLSYFSVVVCMRCLLHHILSRIAHTFRKNWDFVFIIIVLFMMSANSQIRYGLQIVFVCLYITPSHYHHCANLSVDTELMKYLPDIFCRVCKIWAYSLSYPLFNTWGCIFSVYPIPSWWLREYIALSYYHHQIGSMKYYPLFRVRSWNNGMRCMSLYNLMLLDRNQIPFDEWNKTNKKIKDHINLRKYVQRDTKMKITKRKSPHWKTQNQLSFKTICLYLGHWFAILPNVSRTTSCHEYNKKIYIYAIL